MPKPKNSATVAPARAVTAVFAAALAAMSAIGTPAAAQQPLIPLDVRPVQTPMQPPAQTPVQTPASFEVIEARGAGPTEIWCAAADYARRNLGATAPQRIYVAKPLGPSQTQPGHQKAQRSVTFTLTAPDADPDQAQAFSGLQLAFLTVRRAGSSFSLTQALHYCMNRA